MQWLQLPAWKVGDRGEQSHVINRTILRRVQFRLYMYVHKGGLIPHSFHFCTLLSYFYALFQGIFIMHNISDNTSHTVLQFLVLYTQPQ